MRNIIGIFVLVIGLSANAFIDPNELKIGSTYQVSKDTPLMSTTTITSFESMASALSKSHKILKDSQFTVLEVKDNKNGYPDWYRVDASGVMKGWVKVIALYGQDLVDVNAVDNSKRVWLHEREGVKYEVLYTFEETDYKCLDIPGYTDLCDSNPQLNKDEAYLESNGWLEGYYEVKEYNLKMHKGDVVVRITDRGTKKVDLTLDIPIEAAPESVTEVKDELAAEPTVMGEDFKLLPVSSKAKTFTSSGLFFKATPGGVVSVDEEYLANFYIGSSGRCEMTYYNDSDIGTYPDVHIVAYNIYGMAVGSCTDLWAFSSLDPYESDDESVSFKSNNLNKAMENSTIIEKEFERVTHYEVVVK